MNTNSSTYVSPRPVLAGIVTGQAAGLIMAVVVMAVFTLFLGHGPLYPVQVIGSIVFGESALQGTHVGAIVAGLLLHQLGPSLLWGIVFGLLASRLSVSTAQKALVLGLGIGVFSMVDAYVLVPAVMNSLHGVDIWNREVPMFWDWAAHLVFGLSFALYPRVADRFGARN
jgi:hypothetical protein